ncbi:MAG: LysE family translocator, partial [Desulfocapsaceae bacterium]|nr:LysE family translocator [Desulfocapsaceae bacterium]
MLGIEHYFVFLITGILLNMYPGPDSLYIIGRSVSQGKSAGILAALGISTGALFHTFVGALGLSALLLTSANAFTFIKYAGAMYLMYQAILMFKESFNNSTTPIRYQQQGKSLFKIYRQGTITNILNPKVALFFMALIPQFISPSSPNTFLAFLVLGFSFIVTGTIWCLLLALCAAYFSKKLRR